MTKNPNHFLSFDPGERVTGWASFSENGEMTGNGIVSNGLHGLVDYLRKLSPTPKVIISETYRIKDWQHKHHLSTVPTIRVLGVIEGYAYLNGCKFVEQESSFFRDGMRWAGLPIPKGHTPDNQSAVGHGVYYLHKVAHLWEIKL